MTIYVYDFSDYIPAYGPNVLYALFSCMLVCPQPSPKPSFPLPSPYLFIVSSALRTSSSTDDLQPLILCMRAIFYACAFFLMKNDESLDIDTSIEVANSLVSVYKPVLASFSMTHKLVRGTEVG